MRTCLEDNAAANGFDYLALEDGAVVIGILECVPVLVNVHTLLGKVYNTFRIVELNNDNVYLIADLKVFFNLKVGIEAELGIGNDTGLLDTEIDMYLSGCYRGDDALYPFAGTDRLVRRIEHFLKGHGILDFRIFVCCCIRIECDFISHSDIYLLYYIIRR